MKLYAVRDQVFLRLTFNEANKSFWQFYELA